MSEHISHPTQALIKKAFKSIIDDPDSWDQGKYANYCGTSYCLGGWALLHSGWTFDQHAGWKNHLGHHDDPERGLEPIVDEIYGQGFYRNAGYYGTMFSVNIGSLDQLHTKIESAGIDLSEFAEQDDDVNADDDAGKDAEVDFDRDNLDAIRDFVAECSAAGDRMTERHVLGDAILMSLLRKIRHNGIVEGRHQLTSVNPGVLEAQHLLKIEQRHANKLRGDLETQRSSTVELVRQYNDRIDALKAEIRDLRDKVALSPGHRLEAMQKALKERTKQAIQAGTSARIAGAKLRNAEVRVEELRGQVTHLQGTSPYWEQISRENQQLRIALASIRQSTHDLLEGI